MLSYCNYFIDSLELYKGIKKIKKGDLLEVHDGDLYIILDSDLNIEKYYPNTIIKFDVINEFPAHYWSCPAVPSKFSKRDGPCLDSKYYIELNIEEHTEELLDNIQYVHYKNSQNEDIHLLLTYFYIKFGDGLVGNKIVSPIHEGIYKTYEIVYMPAGITKKENKSIKYLTKMFSDHLKQKKIVVTIETQIDLPGKLNPNTTLFLEANPDCKYCIDFNNPDKMKLYNELLKKNNITKDFIKCKNDEDIFVKINKELLSREIVEDPNIVSYRGAARIKEIKQCIKDFQGNNLRMLDVGCNDGKITKIVGDFFKISKSNLYGVDEENIEIFGESVKDREINFTCVKDSLPFSSNFFDIITCFQTLHHVVKRNKMILEIKRVLKPGGILIIREHDLSIEGDISKTIIDFEHYLYILSREPYEKSKKKLKNLYANYTSKQQLDEMIKFPILGSTPNKGPTNYYTCVYQRPLENSIIEDFSSMNLEEKSERDDIYSTVEYDMFCKRQDIDKLSDNYEFRNIIDRLYINIINSVRFKDSAKRVRNSYEKAREECMEKSITSSKHDIMNSVEKILERDSKETAELVLNNELRSMYTFLFNKFPGRDYIDYMRCILRYSAIGMRGQQWALQDKNSMNKNCIEVFASPFNNYFSKYYSIFDEDKIFCSLGIFDLINEPNPSQIYYINPPFVPAILHQIVDLFKNVHSALIITPSWTDAKWYKKLESTCSKFIKQGVKYSSFVNGNYSEQNLIPKFKTTIWVKGDLKHFQDYIAEITHVC